MASHLHKPILYPSDSHYGSNCIRLTYIGNQVEDSTTQNFPECHISNTYLDTLKTWKSRHHILGSKVTVCVTDINPANYINVLYPSKIMSKFPMVFHLCLMESISYQCNCSHELFFIFGVRPKMCINFS